MMKAFLRKLSWLAMRRQKETELREELEFHLSAETEERQAAGLSEEQARSAARRDLGNVTLVAEDTRAAWGWNMFEQVGQDVRYGVRTLSRAPSVALAAVITLALGIGVTTTIFSVVNTVLVQPLPYEDANRLVRIVEQSPPGGGRGAAVERIELNEEWFLEWRSRAQSLSSMGLHRPMPFSTLAVGDQRIRGTGARVTPSILSMLGVQPTIGRAFQPEDEHDNVVILSAGTWRHLFGEDPHAIGRVVTVEGRSHTVVGVMPPTFGFPMSETAFWVQYRFQENPKERRSTSSAVLAQLADGLSPEAATTEANVIAQALRVSGAATASGGRQTGESTFKVIRLKDQLVAPARLPLRVLMAAAVIVLLIVCANVANLLLVRGAARKREMAIRLALGATRARIVRQLLVESVVLGAVGGLAGIALAFAGVRLVRTLTAVTTPELFQFTDRMAYGGSTIMPRFDELAIDPAVLAFAVGASLVTGIVCSVAPALQLSRAERGSQGVSSATPAAASARVTEGHRRLASLLVVGQLTLATTLLIGAGLLIHSFLKLATLNPGYDSTNVLTFQVVLEGDGEPAQKLALADELAARLRARSQVQAVGFINAPPLTLLSVSFGQFVPPGRTVDEMKQDPVKPQGRSVSTEYLRAMGVRLLDGRWFDERDTADAQRVLLVNQSLAQRYFGETSPVGQSVRLMGDTPWLIVGVVEDMRQRLLTQEPVPALFVDARQVIEHGDRMALGFLWYAVRTTGDPMALVPDVRALTRGLDATATLDSVATLEQLRTGAMKRPRFYAVLLGTFAGIAGALAAVGIYGMLAFAVTQRTREIGVRLALGAQPGEVVRLVMRRGVLLTGLGIALGIAGALTLTRLLSSMLFGLTALDPSTYVGVAAFFTAVSITAAYLPARRATKVDPVIALRHE
jgi:predicted permease